MNLDLIVGKRECLLDKGVLERGAEVRPVQDRGSAEPLEGQLTIRAVLKDPDDHALTSDPPVSRNSNQGGRDIITVATVGTYSQECRFVAVGLGNARGPADQGQRRSSPS